jgi:hypothetical protein
MLVEQGAGRKVKLNKNFFPRLDPNVVVFLLP